MFIKSSWILVVLICVTLKIYPALSQCQECMSTNGAYCMNETSYHLCLDPKNPYTVELYHCEEGYVCTTTDNICEPKNGPNGAVNNPVCGGSCNKCPTTGWFACVSKTQFGRCVQGAITMVGTCESGSICSSELYAKTNVICAPQCVADFYGVSATCGNDIPTTTTVATPPIDVDRLMEQCTDALANHPGESSFYIGNADDTECITYIYCEQFDDGMDALLMRCKSGYYDANAGKCVSEIPSACSANPGSPVSPGSRAY